MKPRVFIGSSTKQLQTAHAVQMALAFDCEPVIWTQGVFQLNNSTLDDLIKILDESDFGIFVFGPDDLTLIRDQQYQTTRDNVIFELGLFIGRLGKRRTFFLLPTHVGGFKIPTDLIGVQPAKYDENNSNLLAAIDIACYGIRASLALGIRPDRAQKSSVDQVPIESVLCLASAPYEQLEVQKDIGILEKCFPGKVKSNRSIRSVEFLDMVFSAKAGKGPDILHMVVSHDPKSGSLNFLGKPKDWHRDLAASEEDDLIPAENLVKLLEVSKTRLVVLASCDCLYSASLCFRETNVIAVSGVIGVYEVIKWMDNFYKCLAQGHSLSKAYELTSTASTDRLALFLKKDFCAQIGA